MNRSLEEPERQATVRLTVAGGVHNGPEEQRVGELAVHPEVFVERDETAEDGADEADSIAEDWPLASR